MTLVPAEILYIAVPFSYPWHCSSSLLSLSEHATHYGTYKIRRICPGKTIGPSEGSLREETPTVLIEKNCQNMVLMSEFSVVPTIFIPYLFHFDPFWLFGLFHQNIQHPASIYVLLARWVQLDHLLQILGPNAKHMTSGQCFCSMYIIWLNLLNPKNFRKLYISWNLIIIVTHILSHTHLWCFALVFPKGKNLRPQRQPSPVLYHQTDSSMALTQLGQGNGFKHGFAGYLFNKKSLNFTLENEIIQ